MANDSLDDMLGWLDEAMGEKDVHHSPTIAVGRASSHKPPHYGRSHSCDEIHHHPTHHNNKNNKTRAPSRRHHYIHHRSSEVDDYRNDHVYDDRGYQRASSYSAIESREMTVSSIWYGSLHGTKKLRATITESHSILANDAINPISSLHHITLPTYPRPLLGQSVHSRQRRFTRYRRICCCCCCCFCFYSCRSRDSNRDSLHRNATPSPPLSHVPCHVAHCPTEEAPGNGRGDA